MNDNPREAIAALERLAHWGVVTLKCDAAGLRHLLKGGNSVAVRPVPPELIAMIAAFVVKQYRHPKAVTQ